MSEDAARPHIRIRFRFNIDTGDSEFIIDDVSPERSEEYHDKVASAIASFLDRNPEIRDAGAIRYRLNQEWLVYSSYQQRRNEQGNRNVLNDEVTE